MTRTVIEKEIRDLLGSSRFVYTFAVCAALIFLSFYTGAVNYQANLSHWEAAQAENSRQMEGITDWLRVRDHRIFLPPQPLATLVSGISNDIGRTINVEARGELSAKDSRYNEEPLFAIFRFLDLQFIFTVVLSLFAILLGYDAICGEKERGTLKMCLSNPIPRSSYLIGKFVGSFLALSVSLLIAIGLGCLLLPLVGVNLSGDEWFRLGLIIIAGLLYFAVFLAAAMFVSSLTHRSSNAFLILLVFWVGSVMILPRAAVMLSGRAVDVPSVDEIGYKKASYSTDLWKDFSSSLSGFHPDQTEDINAMMADFNKFMDSVTKIRDDKMNEFEDKLNENRNNKVRERDRLAFSLARISPTATLSLATSALAGTSPSLKDAYHDQAAEYQKSYANFLFEKTGMNVGGSMMIIEVHEDDGESKEPEPIDPSEIPLFEFRQPPVKALLLETLPDIGLLALYSIFLITGAFYSFFRYDAR